MTCARKIREICLRKVKLRMEEIKLICINCPMGCSLVVETDSNKVLRVKGNNCKFGDVYARKEITNPTRIVTSTVEVVGGTLKFVPVKTAEGISKGKIMECMKALKTICIPAPVSVGDVIVENVADTGVNIVATKDVEMESGA